MRVLTSDGIDRWTRGAVILALATLAWAVIAPGGAFWTAVLAAGLIGSAVVTAVFMHSRPVPTLSQVVRSLEREPVVVPTRSSNSARTGVRPTGDRKP